MPRIATCSCGQLKATCEGEPHRVSICHCLACQKRTGSVFGVQAWFREEEVTVGGRSSEWTRKGDDGFTLRFHFCPTCGATVFYRGEFAPGSVGIPVGAFANPTFPPPRVAVYEARRHPWADLPALQVEHLE